MYLSSVGMVSSVGLSATAACAALRAGIAQFQELIYTDNEGEPIIGATVPGIGARVQGRQRLLELLVRAVSDCIRYGLPAQTEDMPLIIGLPESSRPGVEALTAIEIVLELERNLGVRFHPGLCRTVTKGHTSGMAAMRIARDLLQQRGIPACMVCGVDSYINVRSLAWLDRHLRLKTTRNSDGVIPGEAGAAVIIEPQAPSAQGPAVRVAGLGFGHETATVLSEEPLLGLGLTQAARAALSEAGLQMHEITFRVSDASGESFGFREQALVVQRLLRVHLEELPHWHCADSIGDTGAASGICQFILASQAFRKGYAPGSQALCLTSSVPGDRAAAVLQRMSDRSLPLGSH